MSVDAQSSVKSANRVIDVFELLARSKREMSHGEIGEALEIPKSSLTQLLRNLVTRGYLELTANGRNYRLGAALLDLSSQARQQRDLSLIAEPYLRDITRETGESSALNVLKGDAAEVVATVTGQHRLVTHMRLGDQAPLYATSGGKIFLAFMPEAERRAYLKRVKLQPVTAHTISSTSKLSRQLEAVRKDGLAYSHEEFTPGIVGVAVGILDAQGLALASLNVAIPAVRYTPPVREALERELRRVARDLARHVAEPAVPGKGDAG